MILYIYFFNTQAQYSVCVFINSPFGFAQMQFLLTIVGTRAAFYSVRARYLYTIFGGAQFDYIFDLLARKKKKKKINFLYAVSLYFRLLYVR